MPPPLLHRLFNRRMTKRSAPKGNGARYLLKKDEEPQKEGKW